MWRFELKNLISDKNLLGGLKNRMQLADEGVNEFKDRLIEIILSEKQGRRRLQYKQKTKFFFLPLKS